MKEKIITIKVNGASQGQWSNLLLELNLIRKARGENELDTLSLFKLIKEKASELNIDEKFLSRQLNVGFSGGEKNKN